MKDRLQILLVEDTPSDIRLTQEALKEGDIQYDVKVLNDGAEAMEYLKSTATTAEKPDIILLDLNMPKKNGHEVLAEMRNVEGLQQIPVILLTVSRDEEDILKALDLKMNYYLGKPVTADKLNTLLRAISELSTDTTKKANLEGEDAHVRYVMAGNPHTSPAVLRRLAGERNAHIRMRVAENPKTPAEILETLSRDPEAEVRLALAENPSVPGEILARLAQDSDEDVRLSLASNPRLPQNILKSLSNDQQPHIAAMADKSLSGEQRSV